MFEQDVERLRGAYQAFNEGGGIDAILERLAPEFQIRDRQSSPDRQTRYGKEGVKELFDSYMEAFDALQLEPEEFIAAGDQIIVPLQQRIRGKGSGAVVVATDQSWRSCGSSLTRSQSPSRFAARTIITMQTPGKTVSHQ